MKEIGRCVKLMRTMRNLTQETLGAMAGGLSQSTISRLEQGRPVRTDQLERVMHALQCDLRQLLNCNPPPGPFHVVFTPPPSPDS